MGLDRGQDRAVEIFSTCPSSVNSDQATYLRHVVDVARWSEAAGCRGILVYTDNSLVDPWLVSQMIVLNTESLCPLVAVQPVYMHPYSVAKMITSIAHLHRRKIYLNMVAGGFKNDLVALDDTTPHDRRYDRLVEYTNVIMRLLEGGPVTLTGEFYKVDKLALKPPLPPELMPGVFVSGSSEAGLAAARSMRATAVRYPEPPDQCVVAPEDLAATSYGVRVGIIAREHEDVAWQVALERFPEDRKGQLTHQLAMKVSDSSWHKQLSRRDDATGGPRDTYWLGPFQNYKTFCPYLVGSHGQVARELGRYIAAGYRTYILDIPPNEEELGHIGVTFRRALEGAPS